MLSPAQNPILINRFFQILKEAVLFTEGLETFAYLTDYNSLASPNLGYNPEGANTDYFVSKIYEKRKSSEFVFNWPCLVAIEDKSNLNNPFKGNGHGQKIEHTINIYILDPYNDTKDISGSDLKRIPDIYRNSEALLLKVIEYIKGVKFIKIIDNDASERYEYMNLQYAEWLKVHTKIFDYKTPEQLNELAKTDASYRQMIEANQDLTIEYIYNETGEKLAGVATSLIIKSLVCTSPDFDFDFVSNNYIYGDKQ